MTNIRQQRRNVPEGMWGGIYGPGCSQRIPHARFVCQLEMNSFQIFTSRRCVRLCFPFMFVLCAQTRRQQCQFVTFPVPIVAAVPPPASTGCSVETMRANGVPRICPASTSWPFLLPLTPLLALPPVTFVTSAAREWLACHVWRGGGSVFPAFQLQPVRTCCFSASEHSGRD